MLIPALMLVALAGAAAAPARAQTMQPRIIGGGDAAIADHPYQVRLRIVIGSDTFICGGSIRDATHVITAAHCVTNELTRQAVAPANVTVYHGSASVFGGTPAAVSSVDVPAQYLTSDSYDVALLTLSGAIDLTGPNARAIPLARPEQPKTAGYAFATGWGRTDNSSPAVSTTLRGVSVPLRTDATCAAFWRGSYTASRQVCASGGSAAANNPDTCNGDSGGPLAVDLDPSTTATSYVLLGLTSFGTQECGKQNAPAVYTYVQGTGIASFLSATDSRYMSATATSGNFEAPAQRPTAAAPAPPPTTTLFTPPPTPDAALRDTVRPRARVSLVSCKRTRCSFRIAARDSGGRVARLSVKVARRVRTCATRGGARVCRYSTRTRRLKARRTSAGFSVRAKLVPASYKLTAVATDGAGNRSRAAVRRFRVRR